MAERAEMLACLTAYAQSVTMVQAAKNATKSLKGDKTATKEVQIAARKAHEDAVELAQVRRLCPRHLLKVYGSDGVGVGLRERWHRVWFTDAMA